MALQQQTESRLSRAGSSIPATRSGLHRTVSKAASGKSAPESGSVDAPHRGGTEGLKRSSSGAAGLPQRPASTDDLRRSVESTGLKAHAARTAALGVLPCMRLFITLHRFRLLIDSSDYF